MKKLFLPVFAILLATLLMATIPTEAEAKIYEDTENYNGVEVRYSFERRATPIPTVQEVRMTVATDKAETVFIYYEQTGGF